MLLKNRTRLSVEALESREVPAATWAYAGTGLGDASNPSNWVGEVVPTEGEDISIPATTGGIDLSGWSSMSLDKSSTENHLPLLQSTQKPAMAVQNEKEIHENKIAKVATIALSKALSDG